MPDVATDNYCFQMAQGLNHDIGIYNNKYASCNQLPRVPWSLKVIEMSPR